VRVRIRGARNDDPPNSMGCRLALTEMSTTWLGTREAAEELGITLRTLYRFIDEGMVPAYRFGRVIRLKADDVERFIEASRISPGSLEHLYPDLKSSHSSASEPNGT
jgi:excisionase family DNA binding protein